MLVFCWDDLRLRVRLYKHFEYLLLEFASFACIAFVRLVPLTQHGRAVIEKERELFLLHERCLRDVQTVPSIEELNDTAVAVSYLSQ